MCLWGGAPDVISGCSRCVITMYHLMGKCQTTQSSTQAPHTSVLGSLHFLNCNVIFLHSRAEVHTLLPLNLVIICHFPQTANGSSQFNSVFFFFNHTIVVYLLWYHVVSLLCVHTTNCTTVQFDSRQKQGGVQCSSLAFVVWN